MFWPSTINDLLISKRPGLLFYFRGPSGEFNSQGRSKDLERVVNSYNCNKLKRTIMLSAEISTELMLSIDPHPSFKSQPRCQNPCSGLLWLQVVFIRERGMGTPLYKPYIHCMCRPKSYGFVQKTGINLSPILIWNRVRF